MFFCIEFDSNADAVGKQLVMPAKAGIQYAAPPHLMSLLVPTAGDYWIARLRGQ